MVVKLLAARTDTEAKHEVRGVGGTCSDWDMGKLLVLLKLIFGAHIDCQMQELVLILLPWGQPLTGNVNPASDMERKIALGSDKHRFRQSCERGCWRLRPDMGEPV